MHWRNSNFQYAYFILGACNTPIEAHRKCMEAIEDREMALDSAGKNTHLPDGAIGRNSEACMVQAKEELVFLNACRERLEKAIGRVPTMEDYQANQREEWRLELEHRAENYLLTAGGIPPDHFATMRMHPDFPLIADRIEKLKSKIGPGLSLSTLSSPEWKTSVLALEEK